MTKFRSVAWTIGAGFLIVILIIVILGYLEQPNVSHPAEVVLGVVVVLGVSVLILLMFIMAAGFKVLNLTNPNEAVGLPTGTIRAIIALMLILIWVIVSIFLFQIISNLDSTKNADAIKLGQQFYTTMATLVVAISAFYFGSQSVRAAHSALAPKPTPPEITKIIPNKGNQGQANIPLTIIGKNFGSPKLVRLALDTEPPISAIITSFTQTDLSIIECIISLVNNPKLGNWDLIVVNFDGHEYKLEKAFEIQAPPAGA